MRAHGLVLAGLGLLLALPAQAETVYGRVFETLQGSVFTGAKVILLSNPPQQTTTDGQGQYWFRDVKPGAYLVRLVIAGRPEITGRVIVHRGTTIAHLDLSKIGTPGSEDEY
ncbi:carboxypeptidase-like regulatory domain-containing protein [Gloeobacter kilaueensis]|uniref:Protocatechuate 3,4-dioxygenase beta subunit n=1 Tax=Gloeobacter kilaueensis (strain ATCC BAA-2537 / CCAP 1431/1 / ULC 316 / JS1) TaxID=1183438 RepID=U5QCA4_GLOK1|nr:carboxypeptidase-like regulatory domain-containing protein [Gloeobacter kilaueensis]AGY56496.1 protocatechuate 3,4-dioxygenase beta subunit [Gloeobacter kilaueensis JS1]